MDVVWADPECLVEEAVVVAVAALEVESVEEAEVVEAEDDAPVPEGADEVESSVAVEEVLEAEGVSEGTTWLVP